MSVITLDFETYYADGFTLSKLTTEEYIRDPQFQVIGVGIKVNDGETVWVSGTHEEIKKHLDTYDWANSALLCHNTIFDGAILSFIFGIVPYIYLDTLCMARAIHGVDAGGTLKALAEHYRIGVKGEEAARAKGKRREDFTKEELERYGEYCQNDVFLTYLLYTILANGFPLEELKLIDMTIRMFTQPVFEVNDAMLVDRLEEIRAEKLELLGALMDRLECKDEEEVRKKLSSNKQFAELLEELGIDPPKKISPTTGKETYALAKNDVGFIELSEHEDPFIQQLCAVRLGTKSTIEESRIERFIDVGARNKGKLPIPLKYYGAHTGRWSGSDKVNFQNLPSRDKKKKALKNSVVAPEGYTVINSDSSQIEARVLVWLVGQDDVVEQFAEGKDVYSLFATVAFGREVTKANPIERFVGKTCLTGGTRVLTRTGWKPIVEVSLNDELWDGIEWVKHSGVCYMGQKQTIKLYGVELTPDHEILTAHTKWETAQSVQMSDTVFQSALSSATLPLSGMESIYPNRVSSGGGIQSASANGVIVNTLTQLIVSGQVGLRRVMTALKEKLVTSGGGNTSLCYQTILTGQDYLIGCHQLLRGAITNQTQRTSTTVNAVSLYTANGETTGLAFCNTYSPLTGGITPSFRWTGLTSIKDMSRATLGLFRQALTWLIGGESKTLKPVYDILNSGSRNRFTILTDAGPIIVHNCVLGLGYGTGAEKLRHTLKTQPPGADLSELVCKGLVGTYRSVNHKVVDFWGECDRALSDLASWPRGKKPYTIGKHEAVWITPDGIKLPNGLYIRYPQLKWDTSGAKGRFVYKSRKGPVSIWGGAMTENIVQALARIIVGEQMLNINDKYRVVLTVHDAAVVVVPDAEVKPAIEYIDKVMHTPPAWAKGLPVACESKYAHSYGEC